MRLVSVRQCFVATAIYASCAYMHLCMTAHQGSDLLAGSPRRSQACGVMSQAAVSATSANAVLNASTSASCHRRGTCVQAVTIWSIWTAQVSDAAGMQKHSGHHI